MTFLPQTNTRRSVTARAGTTSLGDAACKLAFLLAVGFTAALVFGLIGH